MEIQELPGFTRFIPKILLAVTVTVCDEVYKKIAYWLNNLGRRQNVNKTSNISCSSKFLSLSCINYVDVI